MKTSDITTAIRNYRRAVAQTDRELAGLAGTYVPQKLEEMRRERLAEVRQRLAFQRDAARGASAGAEEAVTAAVMATLTDDSDPQRIVAREAVWARLARRIDAGESVATLVRTASPIELEALASIGRSELGRSWHEEDSTEIAAAYAATPAAQADEGLQAKVAEAEARHTLGGLASVAQGLLDGRPLSRAESNVLNRTDRDLWAEITGADEGAEGE